MAKAKKAKVKKVKIKKVRFYGLNITLQSKDRKGATAYLELIKKIHSEQLSYVVGPEITMVLRTQHESIFQFENKPYTVLYGKLLRFNTIKNWFDQKSQIFQNYELPDGLVPNAFETDYVFIPEAHKFFIKYNNRVNIYQTKVFIGKALSELTVTGEIWRINIMTSSDKIEKILSARVIKSLNVTVSYTNDDIGDEANELIDKMLKDAQTGEATVDFKPDANGSLNPQSKLVKGFIGVAKDNGSATARIVNANGKNETIQTSKYPEKINLEVVETDGQKEDEKKVLFNDIMKKYRVKRKNK